MSEYLSQRNHLNMKIDTDFKLTTSNLITVVSTVIPSIALVSIVDAPPISTGELPEVARPQGWCGRICS